MNGLVVNFDARWIGHHGIGRFASELYAHLPELIPVSGLIKPWSAFDVLYLTFRILGNSRTTWFSPGFNAPIVGLARYVFTIHDLNHLDIPQNSSFLKRLYYRLIVKPACRRAARILTVSEFSRKRIIEWAEVSSEQVVNVGNGVSSCFWNCTEPFAPGYRYLLCVGNRKPHKNELNLLRAFARSQIDRDIRLVFTGRPAQSHFALAVELAISSRVEYVGTLEESRLASLYRGALALVFPSLYEGFGLPAVEAMASGVPVIAANATALPEIVGDAGLLIDPASVDEIATAIQRVCGDAELREELRRKGLARAKLFSWDDVAAKVRAVLNEVRHESFRARQDNLGLRRQRDEVREGVTK